MSMNFQERFKNRRTQIDKLGNFDIGISVGISKPQKNQIFESAVKSPPLSFSEASSETQNVYISPVKEKVVTPRSNKIAEPLPRKQAQSAKPFRTLVSEDNKNKRDYMPLTPVEEFKPYTLKDYQNLKPEKYYELGGLGPSTIGTEEWKQKKEVINRRNQYVRQIRNPAEASAELEKHKETLRKSYLRVNGEHTPPISSVLEEFEKKSSNFHC